MKQVVTVIEDMAALGNIDGVKDVLGLFEKELKKGQAIILYRKPVDGKQTPVAELKTLEDLKVYRKKLLGDDQ